MTQDDRLREWAHQVAEDSPEAPPFPEARIAEARRAAGGRPATGSVLQWHRGAVALGVVAAAVTAIFVASRNGPSRGERVTSVDAPTTTPGTPTTAPAPASTAAPAPTGPVEVDHEVIAYHQDVSADCDGQPPAVTGSFDDVRLEAWGDAPNQRWRLAVTYPDGSTRDLVVEGSAYYPVASYARGDARGRGVSCADNGVGTIVAEPARGPQMFSLNALAPIPVLGAGQPAVIAFTPSGSPVPGEHRDSQGRSARLVRSDQHGYYGDGPTKTASTRTEDWYVDPSSGLILERVVHETGDGVFQAAQRTTLLTHDRVTVDTAIFDTAGYTRTVGTDVYGIPADASTPTPVPPPTQLGVDLGRIWPAQATDETPEQLVRRFATEVVGWPDATIAAGPSDTNRFDIIHDGHTISIDLGPDRAGIIQFAEHLIGGAAPGATSLFRFAARPDATQATVIVNANGTTKAWHADLAAGVTVIALPDLSIGAARSVIILFEDADGTTLAAAGGQF
jgi:hypothetical protein